MVSRQRIVVVGAGIAGLSLAATLDTSRFDVELREAQPERMTGAALGLWPSARRALTQAGVVLPPGAPESRVELHRIDGRSVGRMRVPAVVQVLRRELMAALREAVSESVRQVDEAVVDPTTLAADLVVGADGVRSRVRGVVSPAGDERRATPWVTLRGVRAVGSGGDGAAPGDVSGVAREFWGSGRLFGDAPVAQGRYWFTAHRSELGPEPLTVADVMAEAQVRFSEAAAPVREALAEAGAALGCRGTEPDVLATRLWTTPPLSRYHRGRYVVIGDAAHAAMPNLARGATDAILDAVTLADVLNRDGSLARWEARRLPATQAARWAAGLGMRLATGPWWAV